MKRLRGYLIFALSVGALMLGGCAALQGSNAGVAAWQAACQQYAHQQQVIIKELPTMSKVHLQKVLEVTHQITPLCSTYPKNATVATQEITKAVTTLAIIESVPGGK